MRKGTIELFDYLKRNNFTTILSSGNITPVLKFYQELLNIDYIFGTNPKMNGELIEQIDIEEFVDIVIQDDISNIIKYI